MGIYPGALVFQGPYWSNDVAEVCCAPLRNRTHLNASIF